MGCNATKCLPVFSIWEFIRSWLWKFICWISTDFCFGPLSTIESSGEDNSLSLCMCFFLHCIFRVVFLCCIFSCYIFCVVLKPLHYLLQLLLISVMQRFGQNLKKKVLLDIGRYDQFMILLFACVYFEAIWVKASWIVCWFYFCFWEL